MNKAKIMVLMTCFHNDNDVVEYVKQLSKQTCSDMIIAIVSVNEANNFESLSKQLIELPLECYVYKNDRNLGYLNGCLSGYIKYGNINSIDTVVISNTDIVLLENDAIKKAVDIMKEKKAICFGPSIMLSSSVYQNPFLDIRPTSSKVKMWKTIQGNRMLLIAYTYLARKKRRKNSLKQQASGYVYAVHGSFFLLSNNCMELLVNEKNDIFMYGEELLVAEIVRKLQGKTYYSNEISILHNENSTTSMTNTTIKAKWYNQSFTYLYNSFFKE